jgi:nucleotide-binding universal stress UspA family protein
MEQGEKNINKNILIAVDDSENSHRAVTYVGQMLGDAHGFKVMILHVIAAPEDDYFSSGEERDQWLKQRQKSIDDMLEEYRNELIKAGFNPENVSVRSMLKYCPSMAECILAERDDTQYSTIVVGRQGISRSEEFLFGSVSSKIVTHARKCTVWVVE